MLFLFLIFTLGKVALASFLEQLYFQTELALLALKKTWFGPQNIFNPLMPGGNKEVTYAQTNLQLIAAGLFKYVWSFCYQHALILSRRRRLSYRNQSIDLQKKSMDWFLYDNGLRHERVKELIWCTNDPNVHIHIFRKCWSLILGCFFPVKILKKILNVCLIISLKFH